METYWHKINRKVVIAQPHESGFRSWTQRAIIIQKAIQLHSQTRLKRALEIPKDSRGELNISDIATSLMPTYRVVKGSLERILPASMLRGIELGVSQIRASARGSYDESDTKVNSRINHNEILLHELTHALEYRVEGLSEWTRAYILNRSKGKILKDNHLEYQPRANYYMGKWPDEYAGLMYETIATEILTMGIERIVADPLHLAKTDPEYFWWLVQTFQHFGDIQDTKKVSEIAEQP